MLNAADAPDEGASRLRRTERKTPLSPLRECAGNPFSTQKRRGKERVAQRMICPIPSACLSFPLCASAFFRTSLTPSQKLCKKSATREEHGHPGCAACGHPSRSLAPGRLEALRPHRQGCLCSFAGRTFYTVSKARRPTFCACRHRAICNRTRQFTPSHSPSASNVPHCRNRRPPECRQVRSFQPPRRQKNRHRP